MIGGESPNLASASSAFSIYLKPRTARPLSVAALRAESSPEMQLSSVFDPDVSILEKRKVRCIHYLKQLFEELEATCNRDAVFWLNSSDMTERGIAGIGDVELQTLLLRLLCSVRLQISKGAASFGFYEKVALLVFNEKCADQDAQIRSYLNSINSKHRT